LIPDNAKYIICDTETTGAKDNDTICEIGWVQIDQDFNILEQVESIIDPQQMISPSASGVHGLTNEDCEDYPTIEEFFSLDHPSCYGRKILDPVVLINHRVGFDHARIKPYFPNVVQELDTLRWARRLYPDSDDHKLSTLIYALGLPRSSGAHRVMADVMTAMHLAKHLCDRTGMTLRQLAEASAEPFLVTYMPMGKHKGELIEKVPSSYMRWMLANMDLDPDLKYSVETALQNKKKKYEHTAGADA
jgi:DNA polymerase III epsilon subunit-like protein